MSSKLRISRQPKPEFWQGYYCDGQAWLLHELETLHQAVSKSCQSGHMCQLNTLSSLVLRVPSRSMTLHRSITPKKHGGVSEQAILWESKAYDWLRSP